MGPRIVLLSLLILPALVFAESSKLQPTNLVTKLEVHKGSDATEVVLHGKLTPTFTVFKLKDPERLIVDLIRTEFEVAQLPERVVSSHISRIATTQFRQAGSVVSRLIIGLQPGVHFHAKAVGSMLVVTITKGSVLSRNPPPARIPKATQAVSRPRVVSKQKQPPKQSVAADHRVVESRGNKNNPKPVKIERILSGKDDSLTVLAGQNIDTYDLLEVFEPFRIVLDVYGASMPALKQTQEVSGRFLDRVRLARHPDKVRIVMDCADGKPQAYSVERSSTGIKIRFTPVNGVPSKLAVKPEEPAPRVETKPKARSESKSAPKLPTKPAPKLVDQVSKPQKAKYATLKDVSFRQDSREARVILELDGEATPQVVHVDANSSVLEIPHCKLPILLERTLDTSEFGGSVKSLSAYRVGDEQKVKLVVMTSHQIANRLERRDGKLHWVFESTAKQAFSTRVPSEGKKSSTYSYVPDQVAGYSVRRPELQAAAGGGTKKGGFRGRRISLDFKEADIHNILRLISEVSKLNIITSDEVKGKITVTMRNVPWDQALDIILKTKKLGMIKHGNIIRVATLQELAKERELLQKAAEANRKLEPIRVRLIPVNYAVAKNVEPQVKDVLSDRGSVTVDERTNVLIVKDILEHLVKAEGLVRSLDTETPQVLIEARIVEANRQFVREIGVQWGGNMSFASGTGNPTGLPFPNNVTVGGGADDQSTNRDISGTGNPGQFAINLPAAVGAGSGGALGFIFGSAGGIARLNLRLSALENKGTVKIISAPKIATLDNHKAKIGQGVSIPISVVSAAGVNTQFVEAKLELEVTPHITQEGSILMAIKVTKNEPDFSRTGARGDPTILKKEAETQVMVKDGDTTVIAGIYTKKTSDTLTGVPFLSSIPILGYFFRNAKKNDERTELLIFITPRIVNRLQATVSQR